jgi:hypothetical protein
MVCGLKAATAAAAADVVLKFVVVVCSKCFVAVKAFAMEDAAGVGAMEISTTAAYRRRTENWKKCVTRCEALHQYKVQLFTNMYLNLLTRQNVEDILKHWKYQNFLFSVEITKVKTINLSERLKNS